MQNTISDPQWNKQNEFHSSTPGIFCWDVQPFEIKKNVNQKGYVFQGYHTIQLDIIQKMWQKQYRARKLGIGSQQRV